MRKREKGVVNIEQEKMYNISKHAKERYAERIMNKEDMCDIQQFVVKNEDKILNDINKMLEYGKIIYVGKQSQREGKGKTINVYVNGCWIVLVDTITKTVVTLYKVDLGLGEDFNNQYVSKMEEKIKNAQDEQSKIEQNINEENKKYKQQIDDNVALINEYKSYIKKLTELNEGYETIIKNNNVFIQQAKANVLEVVNKLIGKREF